MFLLFCLILGFGALECSSFITYEFLNCGRFGDQVVNYSKCKWLSMKYNIPLVFKPFANSEAFACHYVEQHFNSMVHNKRVVKVTNEEQLRCISPNTMYVTNYCNTIINKMDIDERYISMLSELKRHLQPRDFLNNSNQAGNIMVVALHIRKGSGEDAPLISMQYFESLHPNYSIFSDTDFFDHLEIVHGKRGGLQLRKIGSDAHYPGKFPPEQYYVDQLKKLEALYPGFHFNIYICTDSTEKANLIRRIENAANLKNATFVDVASRSEFEDFLILLNADCLIRSSSNFSWFAELIGNHKIVLFPRYFSWKESKLLVEDVGIKLCK